jgi:hypothetical protein
MLCLMLISIAAFTTHTNRAFFTRLPTEFAGFGFGWILAQHNMIDLAWHQSSGRAAHTHVRYIMVVSRVTVLNMVATSNSMMCYSYAMVCYVGRYSNNMELNNR